MATRTLTPALLRRIVKEERARIMAEAKKTEAKKKAEAKKKKEMKEADEISSDADELGPEDQADALVHKIDHAKAAGIKNEAAKLEKLTVMERKLARLQRKIQESKRIARSKIIRSAR